MSDLQLAERLFEDNTTWAYAIARKVHSALPPSFELADLQQEALIKLWETAQSYDPEKNDNFRGYAYLGIRGAVLMACRRRAFQDATNDELEPTVLDTRPDPQQQYLEKREQQRRFHSLRHRRRWVAARLVGFPQAAYFEAYICRRVIIDQQDPREVADGMQVSFRLVSRVLQCGVRRLMRMRG